MIQFVAETSSNGVQVLIQHSEHPLHTSLLNESPFATGQFEWGYQGAGPLNLARSMLAYLVAERFGDAFMQEVVAVTSPMEQKAQVVVFREDQILDWLRAKLAAPAVKVGGEL